MKSIRKMAIGFLLLSSTLTYSQVSTEEAEHKAARVKCKVKSATLSKAEYIYSNGERVAGTFIKTDKTKYDKMGNVIEEISYNPRGTIDSWTVYELDKKGNSVKTYYKNADGTVDYFTTTQNEYDCNPPFFRTVFITTN